MFENPHLSVHSQSIQSRESKQKFCKHARSMRALYGWISMNECLGARKSLKRTWWVEMTLKYSSQKKTWYADFQGHHVFGIFSKFKRLLHLGCIFQSCVFVVTFDHLRINMLDNREILSNVHSKKPVPPLAALLSKVSALHGSET